MRSTTRTAHPTRTVRTHRAAARRAGRRAAVQVVHIPRVVAAAHRGRAVRLTRRGRCVLLLLLVGLLFAAFSLGRSGSSVGASTDTAPEAAVVQTTVQPGESLWTVATRIAPESDPREVMEQLRRLNDLSSSSLQAGQQLLLPV